MNVRPKLTPESDTALRGNQLMPRATIEAIVAQRNLALDLYGDAYAALAIADAAVTKAGKACSNLHPKENRYNAHLNEDKAHLLRGITLPPRDEYMVIARKIADTDVWSHIIDITDLQTMMDRQAKDELHQQLLSDPPEATVENIYATLEQFALDAETIFRRGIANCFSQLDRRFRSHDGFKIGSRVILDRMFDESGWWNYHRNMEATLYDIERAFAVLDGTRQSYGGIVDILRRRRQGCHGARQDEVESTYFTVRVFKNGNAHVWFKSDDLLRQVNKLLAEYYGETIGDGMTPEDDGGLFTPKTTLAKHYGFYPTPDAAAKIVVARVALYREKATAPLHILEPSAGTGNLARLCLSYDRERCARGSWESLARNQNLIDCVEIQAPLAAALREENVYRKVICGDFLALRPDAANLYDRVVMNPPFDRERDIDHVMHALKFLKPDGQLVAVMSAGTEFRETRKSIAFRELMARMKADMRDLPTGSFAASGTYINTIVLTLWNDGRSADRFLR